MKKLIVLMMLVACGVEQPRTNTEGYAIEACPQESECEDNRTDRALAAAEAAGRAQVQQQWPGNPIERVTASCTGSQHDFSCSAEFDLGWFNLTVFCVITTNSLGNVTWISCDAGSR